MFGDKDEEVGDGEEHLNDEEVLEEESEETPDAHEKAAETEARRMGWVPKSDWRGDPKRWTPASEYVSRGKEIIPIVKANMRKVEAENEALRGQLQQLQTQFAAASESIEALKQISSKSNIVAAKDARRDLIVQKKKAEEEGEDDLVVELEEKIQDSTAAIREAEGASKKEKEKPAAAAAPATTADPTKTPEFREWKKENPWFGSDEQRSNYAAFTLQQMARTGESKEFSGQKAILDEVTKRVNDMFGDPEVETTAKRKGKVESGKNGSGKGGGAGSSGKGGSDAGSRSYSELPADAKAACERSAKKVVGAKGSGRAFDDINKYRQYYVNKYFEDDSNE